MPFGNLWGLMPYDNSDQLLSPQEALSVQRQGNLGLGAGLLAAAGPSPNPISFGQALSSGLMQGQALQNNAVDSVLKRQLVAQEIQKNRLANQQIQNRPNITGLLHSLPGLSPQQADLIAGVFQIDPKSAVDALDRIPGAMSPATKPDLSETEKKISAIEKAIGRKLTPEEALAAGGVKPEADSPDQKIAAFTKVVGRPPTREEALGLLGGGAALTPNKLDEQVPPSALNELRDANGQKYPVGVTWRDVQGATPTTQPEVDRKNAENTAKLTLDQIEGMALDPKQGGVLLGNPSSLPMQGLNQSGQSIGHFLGTEASGQRQKYVDARTALASSLATAENPNDAVARESAVKRYLALIPDINTPEPEARDKFALLRSRFPGNPAQAPPSGFKFKGFEH